LKLIYLICSVFLVVGSFIPIIDSKHWSVRVFDFFKIQLSIGIFILFWLSFSFTFDSLYWDITFKVLLFIAFCYNFYFIYPFLPQKPFEDSSVNGKHLSLISVNVQQDNKAYDKLIDSVNKGKPDILLTLESNQAWEKAMKPLEDRFRYNLKIPLENKYGMHFYTDLDVVCLNKRFLISKDYPSIEANLVTPEGTEFKFWGVHPPPPSPTEKPTAKQKDAELILLAKQLSDEKLPVLVAGDFNNVSWSKTSKLFSKVSGLKDARLGKGVYGTFPSYAYILRFPIDLVFNSLNIAILKISTLTSIKSDHLPLLVKFRISDSIRKEGLDRDYDDEKVKETIREGIKEQKNED